MSVPESLKPIAPYLKHAQQVEKLDPVVSYYCRYYAIQQGIQLRQKNPQDDATKKALIKLMDQLEEQKKALKEKVDDAKVGEVQVKNFALRVFKVSDDEDRAGKANKSTALNFLSASQFFDVLSQFGPLAPDLEEKRKYAKYKAGYINQCLKKGITPQAGSPAEQQQDKLLEDELNDDTPNSQVPQEPKRNDSIPSFPDIPQQPKGNNIPSFPDIPQTKGYSDIPSFPDIPKTNSNIPSFPDIPQQPKGNSNVPSFPDIPKPSYHQNFPTGPQIQNTPQKPTIPQQPTAPSQPQQTYQSAGANRNFKPSETDVEQATKYTKFVLSSLQFDDVPAAVKNLKLALKHLTGQEFP